MENQGCCERQVIFIDFMDFLPGGSKQIGLEWKGNSGKDCQNLIED